MRKMNENNTITSDLVLDKKLGDYFTSRLNDFKADKEIMVTITLHEYRELIEEKATNKADIDKANKDAYEREQHIKELSSEVASLKDRIYELTYGKREDENAD